VKSFKLYFVFIGMLLATLIVSACSSSSSAEAEFPTGKFMSTVNKYQGYEFKQGNTWAYLSGAGIGAQGTYSVEGNQWVNYGDAECPFPGTYEWTFDGTNLTFKLVGEDACEARKAATDGKTFVITE
jgi:hypothetical protein